jgi:hypothetical protein
MLIGEVVPLAYDFVANNPAHPDVPRYTHIVVDEYQDLNRADQALIDALSAYASVIVVGDEDQSICRFRNAHPEGIVEYPRLMPTHRMSSWTYVGGVLKLSSAWPMLSLDTTSVCRRRSSNHTRRMGAGTVYIVQHPRLRLMLQPKHSLS